MEGSSEGSQYLEESGGQAAVDGENSNVEAKVLDWEEYQEALARFCGLGSLYIKARVKREALKEKLEAAIEVEKVALERADALEALQRRVQAKELQLKSLQDAICKQELARETEFFLSSAQALQISFKVLGNARGRLQVADGLLAGEGGHERLKKLYSLLSARRQRMVAQVASFYPLTSGPPVTSTEGTERGPTNKDGVPLTIAGLQILEPGKKLLGHVKDKHANETSATALGYVGHVVTLVAKYLDVQLRYPIREMVSHSYIQDYSPAIEPPGVDAVTATVAPQYGLQKTVVEFPLFSEGQDSTRSAYGVFLLNKDLEQLLNHLGVESVGPRHTLLNLEKLLSAVQSWKYAAAAATSV